MTKGRMEAFSDGVFAVIITIMVLELKVPHGDDWAALEPLVPVFMTYILSFVFLGIYWTNHHHMLHVTDRINGGILWANLHLLLCAALAYTILARLIIAHQGPHSRLREMTGRDAKGYVSLAIYVAAIPLAFVHQLISDALYLTVALIWLVPDRRIESRL
jgi:uncharacterized membrane protein